MKNYEEFKKEMAQDSELKKSVAEEMTKSSLEGLINVASKYGYAITMKDLESEVLPAVRESDTGGTFILVEQIIVS